MTDWARWRYRRMAWKNDTGLWCTMHPWLTWALGQAYERSWPLRRWFMDFRQAIEDDQKIKAIRDVYGDTGEVKYWKYDGTAADIYREARARGWD